MPEVRKPTVESIFTHVISNLVFSTDTKENFCVIIELNSWSCWVLHHGRLYVTWKQPEQTFFMSGGQNQKNYILAYT